jgi:hypothetical protein
VEVAISAELHLVPDQAPAIARVPVSLQEESGLLVDMPMLVVRGAVMELDKLMEHPVPWVMGMDLDQVPAQAPDMTIAAFMGDTRKRLVVVMPMPEVMGYLVDTAMVKATDKVMGIVGMDHHPPKI